MGNTSGLQCWQVLANSERALAIELLAGAQGVEFLAPLEPGAGTRAAHAAIRTLSAALVEDRSLGTDIEDVAAAIRSGHLLDAVEDVVGELA
jgi:histidine ammonia-lyase